MAEFARALLGAAIVIAVPSLGCGGSGTHDADGKSPAMMAQGSGGAAMTGGSGGSVMHARESSGGAGSGAVGGGGAGGGATGGGGSAGEPDAGHMPVAMHEDAGTDAGADAGMIPASATAFRVKDMYVRDPHLFLGGVDITDDQVNAVLVKNGLTMDWDNNGFLDFSIVGLLAPLDPSVKTARLDVVDALCASESQCQPNAMPGLDVHVTIENRTEGNCLEPISGTTSNYMPAIEVPAAPCFFTTEGRDMTVNLAGINIALTDAKIAAHYDGEPVTQLSSGLLMGFLTDTRATQAALLPSYLPLLGSTPLSDYLLTQDRDEAQSPTGEGGFWLYINFTAIPADYATQ